MVCKLHLNKVINKERSHWRILSKVGGITQQERWWADGVRFFKVKGPCGLDSTQTQEPGNMCQPPALILWVKVLLPPKALPTTKTDSLMQTEPRWRKTPLKTLSRASPFPSLRGHRSFQTHRAWTGRTGWLLWRGYKSPRSQVHSHPGKIPTGTKPSRCLTREDGDTRTRSELSASEPVTCFAH